MPSEQGVEVLKLARGGGHCFPDGGFVVERAMYMVDHSLLSEHVQRVFALAGHHDQSVFSIVALCSRWVST